MKLLEFLSQSTKFSIILMTFTSLSHVPYVEFLVILLIGVLNWKILSYKKHTSVCIFLTNVFSKQPIGLVVLLIQFCLLGFTFFYLWLMLILFTQTLIIFLIQLLNIVLLILPMKCSSLLSTPFLVKSVSSSLIHLLLAFPTCKMMMMILIMIMIIFLWMLFPADVWIFPLVWAKYRAL